MNHLSQDRFKDLSVKFLVKEEVHFQVYKERFLEFEYFLLSLPVCLSFLVLLLGCRTLCLETSIQLNGGRIPVKLIHGKHSHWLKAVNFFLLWSTIAQVKLPREK